LFLLHAIHLITENGDFFTKNFEWNAKQPFLFCEHRFLHMQLDLPKHTPTQIPLKHLKHLIIAGENN